MAKRPQRVRKIGPEEAAARDEGPRLLPYDLKPKPEQFGRRALELADIALGTHPPSPPKKKRKGASS